MNVSRFLYRPLLWTSAVLAFSASAMAQDYDLVRERVESLINGEAEISIAESPIPGMLQVRLGGEIVYITDDARYLMQGRVLDLETRTDLTDLAKTELRRELMADLDTNGLIRFGPDNPDYDLIVFTDVDCGYCRRLHDQIDAYNDAGIRINYLAFPRAGAGSETFRKMTSVWCAADQHEAMNIAKAGDTPRPASCDSPVESQYRLGQAAGVTGTPALVTSDGDLIPGYVPPEDLRARLDALAARNTAD